MGNPFRVSGLLFALCLVLCLPARAEPPERLPFAPDEESAEPGSVGVFPIRHEERAFLDPAGLEAHLKPYQDPDTELVFPAGQWVQPPSGGYFYWLQGGWRMSPHANLFFHSGNEVMAPVASLVDAGKVRLPTEDLQLGPDIVLELLHAGSYREQGFLRWEILLRRSADEIGEGVLLPAGPAVGGLWNRSTRRYVALSRPFTVLGRMAVAVPLEAPQNVAQLVAVIRRHKAARDGEDPETRLALQRVDRKGTPAMPPDFKVTTADKTFSYWYSVPPGRVRLRADSGQTAFESPLIELAAGLIERVDGQLAPWPALDVELDLPSGVVPEKLEVRRLSSGEVVAEQALRPKDDEHRFEKVPPAPLEVVLQTPLGSVSRQVDLSSGQDGSVRLEPDLLTVRGTVYHGDEPHPAKLTFTTTARTTREAEAGEDGLYEVVSLSPFRVVSVELPEVRAAPYMDFFLPPIEESQELDFHLSDAEIRVRVTDATTGQGVDKATVLLRNNYVIPGDPEAEDEELRKDRQRGGSQTVGTDETGTAWLPPLRRGSIEVIASAKGYARMKEPLKVEIPDETVDQSFEVRLEPEGATAALRLRLPTGAPAANAEVMIVRSLSQPTPLFNGRADAEGVVEPPTGTAGVLLAKHPAAAFLVRDWQLPEGEEDPEWSLPALGPPLNVLVRDSSGRGGAPRVELALWVEGRRLSGPALGWLTNRSLATDENGSWRATNLPMGPLAVLAWGIGVRQEAEEGVLDGQATEVGVPWPEVVEVRVVE